MPPKYLVTKIEICPKCEGRKMVQHPAWAEYWAENENKQPMSLEEDRKWFSEHGWDLYVNKDGVPEEEEYCNECEGAGELESEVDLLEVLPDIMAKFEQSSRREKAE